MAFINYIPHEDAPDALHMAAALGPVSCERASSELRAARRAVSGPEEGAGGMVGQEGVQQRVEVALQRRCVHHAVR